MRTGRLRLKWLSPKYLVLAWSGFAVIFFAAVLISVFSTKVARFEEIRAQYKPSDKWIVDRDGVPMESIRTENSRRSLDWTHWQEVSPILQRQLVAVEDQRFYSHLGVDPIALGRAFFTALAGHHRRGASTITMQVFDQLTSAKAQRGSNFTRKFKQIIGALAIERSWSKEQILETYINLLSFRGELVGLRAASFGFFSKSPNALDATESSLLVALIRAPNAAAALVARRACLILKSDDCTELEAFAARSIANPYKIMRERDLIPVLSRRFIIPPSAISPAGSPPSSNVIATSLETRVQNLALQAVREQIRELRERNVNDAAAVVLDTRTGAILAYVGNAGPSLASSPQVDGASMHRQAGSSLKPFVYATAYDMRLLDLSSLIEDSAEDLGVGPGAVYNPRNYDHTFQGLVSSGEALASSLNVPAVRTLMLTGEARVLDRMHQLGFTDLQDEDHYGPSLALGTVDVSLIELTEAYRRLSLFAGSHEFSDETKQKIFTSLSRPEYRRFTFGLDSLLTLPFPAAVKTGTSKDMRDNWCIGFTSEYTVGVWVGNFNGEPMWNVSGMSGAAPIWRSLMVGLHREMPQDLVYAYVPPAEPLKKATIARIRYPQADMLVGIDPDIPKKSQKLPIKIENPQAGHSVFVDGRRLSVARELTLWPISKGRHKVELRNRVGKVVDEVKFLVR
jgi:penicillin-binding protein 1C